ncbi:Hypothetical protein PHPALM_7005 [Phytophthora palmivora]|uniref:Uncharacterized protein n=1 Tax=Phytophthora palmivora TaxID=4796 RepID=A0A2P4YDF2_9STRA|nr:Hypothetical protein PHPALM_7005 [Phytophthora palmivora]
MPHTTVRAIVEKAQRTGSVLPAKRSGRPRVTDSIVDKVILQAVKTNEKSSARMIKEQLLAVYGHLMYWTNNKDRLTKSYLKYLRQLQT